MCYLDESGNTGRRLDDLNQPVYFIAAVMVREDRVRQMSEQLDSLAAHAPTLWPLSEYHGVELFKGTGPWKGVSPNQRIDQYGMALEVLKQVNAIVAYSSVNKQNLATRGMSDPNPHLIALQFLAEKIEKWIRLQKDELSQRVLLVADENHEQEHFSINLIQTMQENGGPVGRGWGLSVALDHFIDSVYFARSDQNRGIQLADLVAFFLNRLARIKTRSGHHRSDDAVIELWSKHIEPQVRTYRDVWP